MGNQKIEVGDVVYWSRVDQICYVVKANKRFNLVVGSITTFSGRYTHYIVSHPISENSLTLISKGDFSYLWAA